MAMLRKICDPVICRKGVPPIDYGELYDVASDTLLESLGTYDESRRSQFGTYLKGSINHAFYGWTRDNRRFERCSLTEEGDRNGNLVKGKSGKQKYVVIADISIDAPIRDENEPMLADMLPSDFNIEAELAREIGISSDSEMEKYLEKLSKRQRQVTGYLPGEYRPSEIKDLLHVSEKEYSDCMMAIRSYKSIRILL